MDFNKSPLVLGQQAFINATMLASLADNCIDFEDRQEAIEMTAKALAWLDKGKTLEANHPELAHHFKTHRENAERALVEAQRRMTTEAAA